MIFFLVTFFCLYIELYYVERTFPFVLDGWMMRDDFFFLLPKPKNKMKELGNNGGERALLFYFLQHRLLLRPVVCRIGFPPQTQK